MKKNYCTQLKNRKAIVSPMALKTAVQNMIAKRSVLVQLGITKKVLENMDTVDLKILLCGLHIATSEAVTRLAELDGSKM